MIRRKFGSCSCKAFALALEQPHFFEPRVVAELIVKLSPSVFLFRRPKNAERSADHLEFKTVRASHFRHNVPYLCASSSQSKFSQHSRAKSSSVFALRIA